VSGVNLDGIETGLLCPEGRLAVSLDRALDICLRHLTPGYLLRAARQRWGKGRLARELCAGQKAPVGKLQGDSASLAMDGFRHPGKAGNQTVLVNTELAPHRIALGPDEGVTGDNEPYLAFGKYLHEPDKLIGAAAVGCGETLPSGRADEAVLQVQGTNPRGLEKDGFAHATSCVFKIVDILLTRPPAADM